MPTFRLVDVDGNDLGPINVHAPIWNAGDRIHRGRDTLLVLEVRRDVGEKDGTLVVRPE